MFNFDSLLGKPSPQEAQEADFAAGFSEGVQLASRLVACIAENTTDKSTAFVDGLFLALREEI
jgi:hypothetical protein